MIKRFGVMTYDGHTHTWSAIDENNLVQGFIKKSDSEKVFTVISADGLHDPQKVYSFLTEAKNYFIEKYSKKGDQK